MRAVIEFLFKRIKANKISINRSARDSCEWKIARKEILIRTVQETFNARFLRSFVQRPSKRFLMEQIASSPGVENIVCISSKNFQGKHEKFRSSILP